MEQPVQQSDQHHGEDQLETTDSTPSWRPPLTTSSLQELRRGDESERTAQPTSPRMSRRTSLDSDRFSTVSGLTSYFPNNPTNVNPAPAYVAPFGASQVVSENQTAARRQSSDEEDDVKNKDDVQFSESALALINAFLDQLLYSFLSTARSTSLLALRPAVTEVLKHRLAKEAIASAEEELSELLAGGDDEEDVDSKHKIAEDGRKWDLELVWKRTRLRVMVYMRLGEMEDEDEQRHVKEEELFQGVERRFSQSGGLVSWTAAIFLTSVLEYIAEQTLQVAGQAANTRTRRQSRAQRLASSDARAPEYLMVEEYDVEKVALNSMLGRLWRTWRKALRNNGAALNTPTHRSSLSMGGASRDNMTSAMSHRSFGTAHEGSVVGESRPMSRDQKDDLAEMEYPEHVLAANIPLPIGNRSRDIDEIEVAGLARDPDEKEDEDENEDSDEPYSDHLVGSLVPLPLLDDQRDVDEIEVPGLARDPDVEDEDTWTVVTRDTIRRNSFAGFAPFRTISGLSTSEDSKPSSPIPDALSPIGRQRSMSLPSSARSPVMKPSIEPGPVEETHAEDRTVDGEPLEDESAQPKSLENGHAEDEPGQGELSKEEDVPEGSPPAKEDAADETSGTAFPWMAGGAVTSTAAAAAAWVLGSKKDDSEQDEALKDQTGGLSAPAAQFTGGRGLGGLINSASQDEGEDAKRASPLDVKKDTSQQSFSDRDIEELDKRKSLIDIKAIMGQSSATSGQGSPEKPQTPIFAGTRSSSNYSRGAGVSEEEGLEDVIGVARTADVPAAPAPGVADMSSASESVTEARGMSPQPTRLTLDEPPSRTIDSQGRPLTPRTLQRQFLDTTSQSRAPKEESEENISPPKSPQRAVLTNGAQQSPSVGSSPNGQSFTAPVDKDSAAAPQKKQSSDSQVQDHPKIQRMASWKKNEPKSPISPKSPRSPTLVNESDKAVPLTSASIRGPEDFDMFVQGGDTLKYTLTPENVRYDPGSGVKPNSPVEMDATSRVGRSLDSKQAEPRNSEDDFRSSKRRSISRPSPQNRAAHRKSGLMAREPRVLTESTRDFADFIRSTGPNKDATIYPILPNASTTSLHSLRSAHINGASASRSSSPGPGAERKKSLSRLNGTDDAVPPVPPVPIKSKATMQPRGATTIGGGSAELIDFIRSGPDEAGKHRISRTVAPFRTTMDSDQLQDLGDRLGTEKPSNLRVSTGAPSVQSASSMRSSSHHTSANSRSALLSAPTMSNQTVQPAYSGQPQTLTGNAQKSEENGRKRFRNKDPYAMYDMDDDDDDEELLTSLPKSTRQEESLMDFLNNNEPPSTATPQPLINPNSAQARNIISNARANGVGSIRSANGRSVPNSAGPHSAPSRQTTVNSSASSATGRTKMQARGGAKDIAKNSNTRDLADFFKSEPPEDLDSAPAPIVGRPTASDTKKKAEKKKGGGFFGRSRKKTYLDMP